MLSAKVFATYSLLVIGAVAQAQTPPNANPFAAPQAAPAAEAQRYPTLPPAPAMATEKNFDAANPAARNYREQMEELSRKVEILRMESLLAELNKKITDLKPAPPPPPPMVTPSLPLAVAPTAAPVVIAKPAPPAEKPFPTILALRGSGSRVTATLKMPDGSERVVQQGARIDGDTVVATISDSGVEVVRKGARRHLDVDTPHAFGGGTLTAPAFPQAAIPGLSLPPAVTPPAMTLR